MAKTMITSPMTDEQIDQAVAVMRAKLRKHRHEVPSDSVQHVFGQKGWDGWYEYWRPRVEAVSTMIIRRVTLDPSRSLQDLLDATGRKQYKDRAVVDAAPRGEGTERLIGVFTLNLSKSNGFISAANLDKEFDLRNMDGDPYGLAQLIIDDPNFADERPCGTQWRDANGNFCYGTFSRWDGGRDVGVHRRDIGWGDGWSFAGRLRNLQDL